MPEWLEQAKYPVILLLGLLAGLPLVWRRRTRLGLEQPWQAPALCAVFSALSVLSAMLFASFEKLISGEGLSFGAISTYGVYFFCPLLLLLLTRALGKRSGDWLDVFALYAVPSLFLLRINCLLSGCCGGRLISGTELHWPTRQAEMVFYAVILLVLLRREKAGAARGTAFPLLMACYGAFRFVEEWFRDDPGNSSLLHLAHGWSLLAVVLGLGFYWALTGRRAGDRRKVRGSR